MKWTTASGEEIDIEKMTDSHLKNTILFIRRKADEGFVIYFGSGYEGDDDFPTPVFDEVQGQEALDSIEEYKYLCEEANKRKLIL